MDTLMGSTAAAFRSIYYHSAVALALSSWDCIMTFGDEVRCIWPMKGSYPFKWLYIFHRYFLLAIQIMCQIALAFLPAMSSPTSSIWLGLLVLMTVLVECTNFTLEFILAFRVFVLFGRHPWVSRLLGGLILAELVCCMPTAYSSFKSYSSGILFELSPNAKIQMSITMVVHSTLISLTVAKHFSIVGASGARKNIISQLTLGGTVTYLMMAGLLGLGFTVSKVPDMQPIILLFWALTVHSICGSRLILNMARMQDHMQGLRGVEDILLTTQIDISLSEDLD